MNHKLCPRTVLDKVIIRDDQHKSQFLEFLDD